MKKFLIISSLLTISMLISMVESVQAHEKSEIISISEKTSVDLEQSARVPMRSSKIWEPDISLPYTGLTHFYERRKFGAIYRGTLDLKPGTYFGDNAIYRGYFYNTQNGTHPLLIELEIE